MPLGQPATTAETRLPLAVPTITSVETWEADGTSYVGVVVSGQTAAYIVLRDVDGAWLVDGWAPL